MSTARSNRLCVILGAGASHDVATEGNKEENTNNKPPLAKELFNIKEHSNYNDYLKYYQDAAFLASYLGARLTNPDRPIGMEEALSELANSVNQVIRKKFAQIPIYLWHLIGAVTNDYVSRPGAYDSLLISLFKKGDFKVLFITMNYDLLLEKALELYFSSNITNMDDYINDSFQLIKPHGSINWWKILPGDREQYMQQNNILTWDSIRNATNEDIVFKNTTITASSRWENVHLEPKDSLWSKYQIPHALYPLITAPLVNKTMNDFVCPLNHSGAAQEYLSDCERFLIIGSSGLDTDLLEFLDGSLNKTLRAVHIVTGNDEDDVRKRYIDGISKFELLNRVNPYNFVSFSRGFKSYLGEGAIDQLLTR